MLKSVRVSRMLCALIGGIVFGLCAAVPGSAEPTIAPAQVGAIIEDVRVDAKGVADARAIGQYLATRKGMRLQPSLIEDDYHRLVDLGYYRVGVTIRDGSRPGTVVVRWTVGEPWLRITANTRYSDPLISLRKGAGITVSGKQFGNGSHLVFDTWQSAWTHDYAVGFVSPVHVDSPHNSQQDFIIDAYGDFEANLYENPVVTTVFNKTTGLEGGWLLRSRNGMRFGIKLRQEHATSAYPSGIMSSAVLPINGRWAKAFLVIAGLSHYCAGLVSACPGQFRLQFTDGTGTFGSSSEFQMYVVDASRYLSLNRATTLALRAATTRTGGVVPEQDLPQLDDLRGFRKPFYGTDDEVFQAELRLNDMRPRSIGVVLFTETGAYRFRNGVGPYNPQTFTFNADSGIALVYRGLHLGVAHSREGYFFTVALGPAF